VTTKKNLIIVVLATFCLTSVLFLIPASSSGIWPYDPWWDLNDDGKIDITDVAMTSGSFGTYGNSTKNVNVTNWPSRGNLTLCTDSQTIIIADAKGNEYTGTVSTPWNVVGWDLPFYSYYSFSPKKGFNNVTRVIIKALIGADKTTGINCSFWLGDFDLYTGLCFRGDINYLSSVNPWEITFIVDNWWNQYLGPYPNSSGLLFLNSIKPGINVARIDAKLAMGYTACTIYTYKVEALIEYTYWDYIG